MADPTTPNIQLAVPTRGSDVGVWDTPANGDFTILDLCIGGTATIGLNNSNVVLTAGQFQSANITLNSTLTGSVTITFPTSFTKTYTIQNLCTGSSQFTITLETTATGGQVIACPPGQPFDCINDGVNLRFKNFGPPVGGYWDYAGSSNPAWNLGCTIPPYLPCDGSTTVSSATYPTLFGIIGGTLPDFRGRHRIYLDAGAGRVSSGTGGVAGNTLFASGGNQVTTLSSQNIPPVPVTDPGHTHGFSPSPLTFAGGSGSNPGGGTGSAENFSITSAVTNISAGSTSPTAFPILSPLAVGGITMIRAA